MGNYLLGLADRIAGTSRLRPRVPSLFEPRRQSDGWAGGFAAMSGGRYAGFEPSAGPLETEAVQEAPAAAHIPLVPEVRHVQPRAAASPQSASEPRAVGAPRRAPISPRSEPTAAPAAIATLAAIATPTAVAAPLTAVAPNEHRSAQARAEYPLTEAAPRARRVERGTATSPTSESEPRFAAPSRLRDDRGAHDEGVFGRRTAATVAAAEPAARAPPERLYPVAVPTEAPAPTVQVLIGKITVHANAPSASPPPPARAVAPAGPRLSLEQYLSQRGGHG
jgi:hypothetical protein